MGFQPRLAGPPARAPLLSTWRVATPATDLPFTLPLVNVSADGVVVGEGLFEAGFKIRVDTGDLDACISQLWTADPEGNATNLVTGTLGIEPLNLTTCGLLPILSTIRLHLFESITVTLEVRQGTAYKAWAEVIGSALLGLINATDPTDPPTLEKALAAHVPLTNATPVQAGVIRLILEVPVLTADQKATLASVLLLEFSGLVNTFAFELYDIPLPTHLKETVEKVVEEHQVTILVPTGQPPVEVVGLPIPDRLLTIRGLAAHPGVLTIGAGSVANLTDPFNRLGPTALYMPKPDFLAPSPAGTTVGAVLISAGFYI